MFVSLLHFGGRVCLVLVWVMSNFRVSHYEMFFVCSCRRPLPKDYVTGIGYNLITLLAWGNLQQHEVHVKFREKPPELSKVPVITGVSVMQ